MRFCEIWGGHHAFCVGHHVKLTSCAFIHVKNGFYHLEKLNYRDMLGMKVRTFAYFA